MSDLKIPWNELSDDALMGIIEEFVTREGTEYGDSELSLEVKCQQVRLQLRGGEAFITYDEELRTCSISPAS
ncbi:MAG: YheU family protein [Proteobacteria bacterium]|nr:YheU family protein [Pseudomonadota bacterium]